MTITALALLLALQTLSVSAARRLGGLHQVGGGERSGRPTSSTAARRYAAGGPLDANVLKCQLKPIDAKDYAAFSASELARLRSIFRRSRLRHTSAKDSNGHNGKVTNLY